MKTVLFVAAAFAALTGMACGGGDGKSDAASELRSPTASATPSVAPTPDFDVESVAKAIEDDVTAARNIVAAFQAANGGATVSNVEFLQSVLDAVTSCSTDTTKEISAGRSESRAYLRPRAFEDLHAAVVKACSTIAVLPSIEGGATERSNWIAASRLQGSNVTSALSAAPDYSPAQLRRTLAERR